MRASATWIKTYTSLTPEPKKNTHICILTSVQEERYTQILALKSLICWSENDTRTPNFNATSNTKALIPDLNGGGGRLAFLMSMWPPARPLYKPELERLGQD